MKNLKKTLLGTSVTLLALSVNPAAYADAFIDALKGGKATGSFNLRYENADQPTTSGNALTLRSRIGYKTASVDGFYGLMEFEDSRTLFGIDDYKEGPYDSASTDSVIADPEVTEVEQAFIGYKADSIDAKLGRQVLTLDGHRHVGHVGWRQDRQTFDALNVKYTSGAFAADVSYVFKHNRIFGEVLDVASSDLLLNLSYKTDLGKVVAYSYQIDPDPAGREDLDTLGVSFTGGMKGDFPLTYHVEYATQDNNKGQDTSYLALEVGTSFSGVTVKLGQETLGSDNGNAVFATPLATLHKFNGFADVFLLGTFQSGGLKSGLVDTYLSAKTKVSGVALTAAYHDFKADHGSADLGDELDLVAATKFGAYTVGFKYAMYRGATSASDIDRTWLWVSTGF